MFTRREIIASLATFPIAGYAQVRAPVASSVIGIGSFVFPIPGTYTYERQPQGMLIATADGKRVYSTAQFASPAQETPGGHIARLEQVTRRNWERFAVEEKGVVVREFRRTDISSSLTVFSMATQYGGEKDAHYYVQFAATTGAQTVMMFVEGGGSAAEVLAELEPLVLKVSAKR